MSPASLMTVALLGCAGGVFAGLLGFGGGVIMFPLLLFVPPLLGLPPLDPKTVAAIVVTQVFFSTVMGGIAHLRSGRVQWRLAATAGSSSALGAFAGGVASIWVSERFLLALFAVVALITCGLTALPPPTDAQERVPVEKVTFPVNTLILLSLVGGVIVGLLGAGNFMFVPLLIYLMKVPTRIAIASSLFIAMINTFSGFVGKLTAGQIPLTPAAAVVLGAGLGAYLGGHLHGSFSPQVLRRIYAVMVFVIAIRVLITLLGLDR